MMIKTHLTFTALCLLVLDLYCTSKMILEDDIDKSTQYCKIGIGLSVSVILICLYSWVML